jgi:hypothetical protein
MAAGENREKVVAWMKSLLEELPEEGKNFVMMDSTHTRSLGSKRLYPSFDD